MKELRGLILPILLAIVLGACASNPAAGSPLTQGQATAPSALASSSVSVPSATPAPTRTPLPTATPAPTRTPLPSATPAPPSPTTEPLEPSPTLAPLAAEQRKQVFTQVWETVRDHYLYEDYGGLDWTATRDEFAPRVAAAATPEEFYGLMRELIDRLNDDHSRFESPQDVAAQEAEFAGELRYGGIGAEIRDEDEGGLVTSVVPGGPAARAGLQPRDLIIAIDGIAYTDGEAFGIDGPIGRVRGEPGTSLRLTVRSPNQPPREVQLVREIIDTDEFNRVSAERLPNGNIGLLKIPSFYVESVDVHTRAAIEELLAAGPLDGLIIDVRSNSGGYVHLMRNTIALFQDGGSIGSTRGRDAGEEQIIPGGQTIAGMDGVPIVVLIGPDSVSATEMFAAGMRVLGRARLVGLPSAGNTENLYPYSFDDGSRMLLAEVAYRLPDGTLIEGRGALPDREIDAEWWRYPTAEDPQILAAVEELQLRGAQ